MAWGLACRYGHAYRRTDKVAGSSRCSVSFTAYSRLGCFYTKKSKYMMAIIAILHCTHLQTKDIPSPPHSWILTRVADPSGSPPGSGSTKKMPDLMQITLFFFKLIVEILWDIILSYKERIQEKLQEKFDFRGVMDLEFKLKLGPDPTKSSRIVSDPYPQPWIIPPAPLAARECFMLEHFLMFNRPRVINPTK